MASLIQPYIDKENAPAAGAASRKGRLHSLGARPTVGKTFGGDALKPQTPRQVLGNISNDNNAKRNISHGKPLMRKQDPLQSTKKPNLVKRPVGLSNRKSSISSTSTQPLLLKKNVTKLAAPVFKLPASVIGDNLPPVEQMHIFEDKADFANGLPLEHCLSSHLGRLLPIRPPTRERVLPSPPPFDASSFTFENAVRPLFEDEKPQVPITEFESSLQLPPVETLDFLDINNIRISEDQD